jgi:hypothetical protein
VTPLESAAVRRLELAGVGLLGLAGLALWIAYPVAPTFDTAYSLVWGHEILAGHLPSFAAYRAPTEHPLWVALGLVGAAFGDAGNRLVTLLGFVSLVALVAGLHRLARAAFGGAAAVCACLLLLSRFHFTFYAAFAYLDVPYLALLVWAAALEARRPRRGGVVWVLLVLAGLLRPEAWLYALGYAVWLGRDSAWPARTRLLALVALPALIWCLLDLVVTGHPTFSFTFTTGHAEQLARRRPPLAVPGAIVGGLDDLMKLPVLLLAVAGVGLAWRERRRAGVGGGVACVGAGVGGVGAGGPGSAAWIVLACAVAGVLSFVVTSLAGFAVVNRYLAFAAVALFCFAGWALAQALGLIWRGARRLAPGALAAAVVLLAGVVWVGVHFHPAGAASELRLRVQIESQVRAVLASDVVAQARRCGPVSVPNHKLVPLVRLDIGGPGSAVVARSDPAAAVAEREGAALVETGGSRVLYDAEYGPFGNDSHDPQTINDPPAGFHEVLRTPYLLVYVNCRR